MTITPGKKWSVWTRYRFFSCAPVCSLCMTAARFYTHVQWEIVSYHK